MSFIEFKSGFCDLHVHSTCSDGTDTVRELVDGARELGLAAIALTDHNTARGVPELMEYAAQRGVCAIGGCEVSTSSRYGELHVLGLFLDGAACSALEAYLAPYVNAKRESNRSLIASLNAAGYKIDHDTVAAAVVGGVFNRAHVAVELTRLGYTASKDEAFATLLRKGGEHYREPMRLGTEECIRYLSGLGAAVVLAHPLLNLNEAQLRELLPGMKAAGLDGMETYYTTYTDAECALALSIADDFGLLASGGSDYHGERKPGNRLGTGYGTLSVPADIILPLKGRAEEKKQRRDTI